MVIAFAVVSCPPPRKSISKPEHGLVVELGAVGGPGRHEGRDHVVAGGGAAVGDEREEEVPDALVALGLHVTTRPPGCR